MDYTNQIGEKIKSLCEFKNISVSELSERTGLAPEQIDRIINNIDIPSLAPLIKIARALGVRLGTFLDDQINEDGPVVCRHQDTEDTISFSNNAVDSRKHMAYHSLSRSKSDRYSRTAGQPFYSVISRRRGIHYGDAGNAGNKLWQ